MKKALVYPGFHFSVETLREALSETMKIAKGKISKGSEHLENFSFTVDHDDARWSLDSSEEFFADYRKHDGFAELTYVSINPSISLQVRRKDRNTDILVSARERSDIERVFDVFARNKDSARLPPSEVPVPHNTVAKPIIFIGHGRSSAWRDLKEHLQDKHGCQVEAYETGARAGHTIRDILEEMIAKSSCALLVLTGEDEQADGKIRARQNVIHEVGLFQGRLGFHRAVLLLEEGVEEFSNMQGVQYIAFSKGKIKETFGEVLATLRREFGASA